MNVGEWPSVVEVARNYLQRGWYPVPMPPRAKRPLAAGWQDLRLAEGDLPLAFGGNANIGILLGAPSGWLVDVDLDCSEARALAAKYLPPTPVVTGRGQRPATHWWYIAEGVETVQHRDPETREMIIELRSTGAQTVVGPSVHPQGDRYDLLIGDPARVEGPELVAAVEALANRVIELRHGVAPAKPIGAPPLVGTLPRVASSHDIEGRAIAYLDAMPPAVSGRGGHSATYAAATALVHGFALSPERALDILREHYNTRCEPPWSEKELQHKVEDAARKPHDRPHGWLLASSVPVAEDSADISALVAQAATVRTGSVARDEPALEPVDPGPIPVELLRIPGFVSEVMDYCLETAPYPNAALAFCGALALLAFLAGCKVRDQADNRTNLYLLGLAHSSSGKDWPRKINARILHAVDLSHCLGDRFASGEGLQDALYVSPSMLFQTDEIDGLLQSINKANDARHEGILGTLLTMYSASNSVFPMRRKAGREPAGAIDQPSLVVYGTAIPNHYYEALSERMLTNGFFARMIIVESGPRGAGQEPQIVDLPPRVLETATWWSDFNPGAGNLENWHPRPKVVETTDDARRALAASRRECEAEYSKAEERGDPVGTTVWGRANEHVRKLSLLYAVSASHREPQIDLAAMRWATGFAMHQTRRMLFMAQSHVAANPFHAECLKLLKKLREAPERMLPHQVLLKRMKMDAHSFQKLVDTLRQREEIELVPIKTATRSGTAYRLLA